MSQSEEFTPLDMLGSASLLRLSPAARMIQQWLRKAGYGRLNVVLPTGEHIVHTGALPGPDATIVLKGWKGLLRLLAAGDIGFAEGYIHEDWTTPDLTALLKFAARNGKAVMPAAQARLGVGLLNRLRHRFNANTRRGSRRNIEAHYDLGNDFYKAWLDPTMLYSSAIFDRPEMSLEAAQYRKLDRIREKLDLRGGEGVLEIGCGWGALAADLAQKSDARVTGITLSPSQLAWAKDVLRQRQLEDRVSLHLKDYRDLQGLFDRIVSIEMFEAVGEQYWPDYFATLKRSLKPGGRAVLQIITIDEDRFDRYRRRADFIQKYIFPGGFLPSDTAIAAQVERSGLALTEVEHFGQSYARTLAEWRTRFNANWERIEPLGFDARFRRLWNYYLSYCEAGFEEGTINVGFYTIEHPAGG